MPEQMFSGLLEGFRSDVQVIKDVVAIHDRARSLYYTPALPDDSPDLSGSSHNDAWAGLRTLTVKSPDWRVYDHCAALTRLYALYEAFVEDLVEEFLDQLPELYVKYQDLPPSLLKQHRAGCGQVLLKMGESGPFKLIAEGEMDSRLLGRTGGGDPYSLLKQAFFVDRHNYRAEVLARLFGYLGIGGLTYRITKYPSMIEFLRERGPETTYEAELNRLVGLRNDAAHGPVDEAVGTDEIWFFADFLDVLSQVLVAFVTFEIVQRRLALGQMVELGTVQEIHYKGRVLIVRMNAVAISVGDSVAIGDPNLRELARIDSIQDEGRSCETVLPGEGKILGFGLTWRIRPRSGLVLYGFPTAPETAELFAVEEVEPAAQADSDRDQAFQAGVGEGEPGDGEGGAITE